MRHFAGEAVGETALGRNQFTTYATATIVKGLSTHHPVQTVTTIVPAACTGAYSQRLRPVVR